jgi:hypothetical protein
MIEPVNTKLAVIKVQLGLVPGGQHPRITRTAQIQTILCVTVAKQSEVRLLAIVRPTQLNYVDSLRANFQQWPSKSKALG